MPVRQAFQKLRSESFLIIAKGKRPVVGSGRVPWNFQQLRGFTEEMRRRGLSPSARLLRMELLEPDLEVAQALKLSPKEKIYRLERLRFVDAEPVAVVTNSYLPALASSPASTSRTWRSSRSTTYSRTYTGENYSEPRRISAPEATAEVAEILQTSAGSPLLSIRETTYDVQNVAIEYSLSLLRADRYTASVISVRP